MFCRRLRMQLHDLNDPAFGGFDGAHLNAGEGFVQLLDLGTEASVGDLLAMVHNLAQGGDRKSTRLNSSHCL